MLVEPRRIRGIIAYRQKDGAMTYRGIVKNGVVVVEPGAKIPEGTPVQVVPLDQDAHKGGELPAFGLWRDRTDLPDSGAASLKLRAQAEKRDSDG